MPSTIKGDHTILYQFGRVGTVAGTRFGGASNQLAIFGQRVFLTRFQFVSLNDLCDLRAYWIHIHNRFIILGRMIIQSRLAQVYYRMKRDNEKAQTTSEFYIWEQLDREKTVFHGGS